MSALFKPIVQIETVYSINTSYFFIYLLKNPFYGHWVKVSSQQSLSWQSLLNFESERDYKYENWYLQISNQKFKWLGKAKKNTKKPIVINNNHMAAFININDFKDEKNK